MGSLPSKKGPSHSSTKVSTKLAPSRSMAPVTGLCDGGRELGRVEEELVVPAVVDLALVGLDREHRELGLVERIEAHLRRALVDRLLERDDDGVDPVFGDQGEQLVDGLAGVSLEPFGLCHFFAASFSIRSTAARSRHGGDAAARTWALRPDAGTSCRVVDRFAYPRRTVSISLSISACARSQSSSSRAMRSDKSPRRLSAPCRRSLFASS
jgi:hypothetical protein